MLDLSIVIITYNRAELLGKTLKSLSESIFSQCEIIVLNNCSTDNTIGVVNSFKGKFSDYTLITHKFNIGGNANILRAYEFGKQYYKWILCDDDILDFSKIDDLISVIERKDADLIRVTDLGVVKKERGTLKSLEELLHDKDSLSFYSFGFVPAIIFKSGNVESKIQYGYRNLHTAYSQLFVIMNSFGLECKVYTTKENILSRGPGVMSIGSEIIIYQILSLDALPTKKAKKVAMGWRRKEQRLWNYLFGYSLLILNDYRMKRKRSFMIKTWLKTISLAPSFFIKILIFVNGFPIFIPMRMIAKILNKKLSVDIQEVEKRGMF